MLHRRPNKFAPKTYKPLRYLFVYADPANRIPLRRGCFYTLIFRSRTKTHNDRGSGILYYIVFAVHIFINIITYMDLRRKQISRHRRNY